MRQRLDKVTELALAALLEIADTAAAAPMPPSLQVKALLWLLFSRSNRDRDPYARFWATMTQPGVGVQPEYVRSTYARTYWMGIARSVGATPEQAGFQEALLGAARQFFDEQSGVTRPNIPR